MDTSAAEINSQQNAAEMLSASVCSRVAALLWMGSDSATVKESESDFIEQVAALSSSQYT